MPGLGGVPSPGGGSGPGGSGPRGVPGPEGGWSWGGSDPGGLPGPGGCLVEPPGRLLLRVVRILLECILVRNNFLVAL